MPRGDSQTLVLGEGKSTNLVSKRLLAAITIIAASITTFTCMYSCGRNLYRFSNLGKPSLTETKLITREFSVYTLLSPLSHYLLHSWTLVRSLHQQMPLQQNGPVSVSVLRISNDISIFGRRCHRHRFFFLLSFIPNECCSYQSRLSEAPKIECSCY